MEFRVVTEFIMIMIVLTLGLLVLVSVTPYLQSINRPVASPLVEMVYSYSYNESNTLYVWIGYLYDYDPNSIILTSITLTGNASINIINITINDELYYDNGVYPMGRRYLLRDRLNNITIYFESSPDLGGDIIYTITFEGGYSLVGPTRVIKEAG